MFDKLAPLFTLDNLRELAIFAGILIGFALTGRLLLHFLGNGLARFTQRTAIRADEIILNALKGPFFWAIVLIGVAVAKGQSTLLPSDWNSALDDALFVGFTLVIYIALYKLLRDLLDWYIHEKARETQTTLDDLLLPFLRRVLLIVLTVGTFVLILQYFTIPVGSFLATLGVGSLAVALAAQAAFADIISGFLILLDRRYRIGDRIELPQENILGDVVDIGLRTTRVLTMDYRTIIIPNSMIANNVVINHAYPDATLRIDLPIGVAYGSDIRHTKAILLNAVRKVPGVQHQRPPDIVLESFGDSAVNLEVRCWINAYADKPKMKDRLNEAIYVALNEAGIEIPYPQRTLWHRVESQAVPMLQALLNGTEPAEGLEEPPLLQSNEEKTEGEPPESPPNKSTREESSTTHG